jgi:NADPH-dependent 2,4-dienoyl-CoA reductase/sulfur reductase-like enzyme
MTHHFETLVVGSGPAGIAAAVCAAESGTRVGLVDDNPSAGGQIWRPGMQSKSVISHGGAATEWRKRLFAARVTSLQRWSVFDQPSPNMLRAERGGEAANFRYDNLILATGARERFLPFPGWTFPNVMGVGAIQAMVKGGLPIRGKRVVIAGSGPLLLAVAASLKAAGAVVVCVCEQASIAKLLPFVLSLVATPGKIAEGIRYKAATWQIPFYTSSWPIRVQALSPNDTNSSLTVTLSIDGSLKTVACDYLACGFHLVPTIELPALLGCELTNGAVTVNEWQQTSVPGIYCAGETTGIGGLELSLIEGQIAGFTSAGKTDRAHELFAQKRKLSRFASRLETAFALRPELKALPENGTLLCRCEDVPYGAVRDQLSWRAAKLHTRCGMGPCQGRICGSAAEFLLGWNVDSVRPPVFPALISSLGFKETFDEPEEIPEFESATKI